MPVDAAADVPPVRGSTEGGPCGTVADCRGYLGPICQSPGAKFSCITACVVGLDTCTTDDDCAAASGQKMICDPAPATACYCQPVKMCLPGCRATADCGAGQACDTTHHCQATCVPGSCPTDFTCGADSFCYRTTCATDSDCPTVCVNGACYDQPGKCVGTPL